MCKVVWFKCLIREYTCTVTSKKCKSVFVFNFALLRRSLSQLQSLRQNTETILCLQMHDQPLVLFLDGMSGRSTFSPRVNFRPNISKWEDDSLFYVRYYSCGEVVAHFTSGLSYLGFVESRGSVSITTCNESKFCNLDKRYPSR